MHLDSVKQIELTQLFDFPGLIRDSTAFNYQSSMCIVVGWNGHGTNALHNECSSAYVPSAVFLLDSASVLYVYNCCLELQGLSKCPMAISLA